MSGSITKQIIAKGKKNPDIVTTDDKVKAEKELTTEDKVRLGAAGLLMDFADEGEAFFESLFSLVMMICQHLVKDMQKI